MATTKKTGGPKRERGLKTEPLGDRIYTHQLTTRVTSEQYEAIAQVARELGLSPATFIREVTLAAISRLDTSTYRRAHEVGELLAKRTRPA